MYTKEEVNKIFMLGRALRHPRRQNILSIISEAKRINVTDIYVKLRLEQCVVSQHLKILLDSNLVEAERDGKYIFYSINHETRKLIDQIMIEIDELAPA